MVHVGHVARRIDGMWILPAMSCEGVMAGSPQPPSIGFQVSVTEGGDIQGSDGRQTSMLSARTNLAHLLGLGRWLRRIGTSGEGWKTRFYQSYGTALVHRRMRHLQQLCGAVEAKSPQSLQFFGDVRAHCPQWGLPTCPYGRGGPFPRRDRADIAV